MSKPVFAEIALLILACAVLSACDTRPVPDRRLAADDVTQVREPARPDRRTIMDAIERQVVLPPGAQPLDRYARFYADGPGGDVTGVYVGQPPPEWTTGTRQWVDRLGDLPAIDDGGCSVIGLVYDPVRRTLRGVACNGPPPPDRAIAARP